MITDEARGLSQPRPSEVPSILEHRVTETSRTLVEDSEEMKMAGVPCGCETSETVMMASWPYVVEPSENITCSGARNDTR